MRTRRQDSTVQRGSYGLRGAGGWILIRGVDGRA